MQERWVEYGSWFINMTHTTTITLSDDCWGIDFFSTDGTYITVEYDCEQDGKEIIRAIIRGDYDVPMCAEPTDAQASPSVDEPESAFDIGDKVDVLEDMEDGTRKVLETGEVLEKRLWCTSDDTGLTNTWEYAVFYTHERETEWVAEENLRHEMPF